MLMMGDFFRRRDLDRVLTRVFGAPESFFDDAVGPVWRTAVCGAALLAGAVPPRTAASVAWVAESLRCASGGARWLKLCEPTSENALAVATQAVAALKIARVRVTLCDALDCSWARGAAAACLVDAVDIVWARPDVDDGPTEVNFDVLTRLAARFGVDALASAGVFRRPGVAVRQLADAAGHDMPVSKKARLAEYVWVAHTGRQPADGLFRDACNNGCVDAARRLADRDPELVSELYYGGGGDLLRASEYRPAVVNVVRWLAGRCAECVFSCKCGDYDCLDRAIIHLASVGDVLSMLLLPRRSRAAAAAAFQKAVDCGQAAAAAWLRHLDPAAAASTPAARYSAAAPPGLAVWAARLRPPAAPTRFCSKSRLYDAPAASLRRQGRLADLVWLANTADIVDVLCLDEELGHDDPLAVRLWIEAQRKMRT